MNELLASRRTRLVLLLVVATTAITVLAFKAAGASISYYLTPVEFLADPAYDGARVRVAGRVVDGTVVERAGRPIAFTIEGDAQDRVSVSYPSGEVPNLFGPYALVIVEGVGRSGGYVDADSIIIRHEAEFFSDVPPSDSISSHFVPTPTAEP